MTSDFLSTEQQKKNERFEYDFPDRPLAGRLILLPGGAGGLGAATTALLAAEGAHVVVGYRSNRQRAQRLTQTLNQRGPGKVVCVEADLSTADGRAHLLAQTLAHSLTHNLTPSGELYGFVSFLGDPARVKPDALDEAALQASFTANYTAPLLLARAVGLHMQKKQVPGSFVFLSSMQSSATFEGSLNYAGPKAALVQAARILGREWGPHLRVNVVAPGVNAAGMALASIQSGKYDRFVRDGLIARFGQPEDVARVIRLLLEPDNYLTGQVITIDGGLTLRRG